MAYPDIISLLRTYLLAAPVSLGVTVASRVPDPRPTQWLQLRRVGGTQQRPVRDQPRIDAIVWDDDEPGAWTLADKVRRAIHDLAGTTKLGPMVYRVDEFLGPTFSDDTVAGAVRVMATYSISVRADDAIAR
jgi:hypothetical protein